MNTTESNLKHRHVKVEIPEMLKKQEVEVEMPLEIESEPRKEEAGKDLKISGASSKSH